MYNTFEEIARRYALALFEVAEEANELDTIARDLENLDQCFKNSAELRLVIRTPGIEPQAFGAVFGEILKRLDACETMRRFVSLICGRKRYFILPAIIRHFDTMLRKKRGEINARVLSAQPLEASQLDSLVKALQPFAPNGSIQIESAIDSELIGGLKILIGASLIDLSVQHRLQTLHRTLSEA